MGTRSLCRKEAECLGNNQNNHSFIMVITEQATAVDTHNVKIFYK